MVTIFVSYVIALYLSMQVMVEYKYTRSGGDATEDIKQQPKRERLYFRVPYHLYQLKAC